MTNKQTAKAQQMRDAGMSYQKIGDRVGVSSSTVRRNLNPAAKQHRATYYQDHKEEILQHATAYYQDHKEEKAKYQNAYYRDHAEERIQYAVEYRREHKAERAQWAAKYRQEHLSEYAACDAIRRAVKAGFLAGATTAQRAEIAEIYRRAQEDPRVRCYLCGKLIPMGHRHVDHIMPSSKGGTYRPSNLAVACDECNMHKSNKLPEEVGVLL